MQSVLCVSGITAIMCTQSKQLESKIDCCKLYYVCNYHGVLSSCADTRLNTVIKGVYLFCLAHLSYAPFRGLVSRNEVIISYCMA